MVVGDVIVDLDSMLTVTTLDFQPAAGVEILITKGSSNDTTAGSIFLEQTDGTLAAFVVDLATIASQNLTIKFFINNTLYLRRDNGSASTKSLGYSGVQTG